MATNLQITTGSNHFNNLCCFYCSIYTNLNAVTIVPRCKFCCETGIQPIPRSEILGTEKIL